MNTELLKSKLLEAAFNGSLTHADTSTWEFPKIGDIAFTTSGGTPQAKNKEYYESGNIRWIRSGELGVKYIYDSEIKITQKALENSSAKYYPVDSVLIALYGATVGKVAILKAESTSNQAVCAIFPNERFTPEYMYYFLSSQRDNFLGIASGGAQSNISQEKVKNSIIPLPSIAEQLRIVAALEEGFAYIDAVASAKQNLSDTAELLRNKILQAAFDGSLTGADVDTWNDVRLGEVIDIISGTSYKKEDVTTDGIRVLRGGNIQNDKLVLEDDDVFLPVEYRDIDKCIKKGDTIIVASTGSQTLIGKPALINDDYMDVQIGAFLRIIRPKNSEHAPYIQKFMISPNYKEYIRMQAKGTNINNIKNKYLTELPIPLPPLAEQQRIVAKIEELFTQIDKITK